MKRTAKPKPNSKPAKKTIHPPKPSPPGSNVQGYAGPVNWPMPRKWK
jgi:hypothetical protein